MYQCTVNQGHMEDSHYKRAGNELNSILEHWQPWSPDGNKSGQRYQKLPIQE
jgi:hypothetical protein